MPNADQYLKRLVDPLLDRLTSSFPAIMLIGPRAIGKTTTAWLRSESVVHLDQADQAQPFSIDPDALLKRFPEPVLLDEWQEVPAVLGAVKRTVDQSTKRDLRFLITGSVDAQWSAGTWPGTGRVINVHMWGLTQREIECRPLEGLTFLERCVEGGPFSSGSGMKIEDYLEIALRGGFPDTLMLDEFDRRRWQQTYLSQLLTKDVRLLDHRPDSFKLSRYVEAVCANTANAVNNKTLYDAAGVDSATASNYEGVLASVMFSEILPAWHSNRLKRLIKTGKRHVVDPALVAAVLDLSVDDLLRDGSMMGRMLESFVVAQLRPELAIANKRISLSHLRTDSGRHEVDLVAEVGYRRVIGIEVKAGGVVKKEDAKHLIWLRDELGDDFINGVVLHTGPHVYEVDFRITAVPISAIWM